MKPHYISHENVGALVRWDRAVEALRAGHEKPKAEVGDLFLGPESATLLNRAAYIEGLGYGVKAVTVMRENATRGLPTVQGAMMVYEPNSGTVSAIIDSRLVTEIKTASDSVLGAQLLARPDSRKLLIMGAGVVARSLIEAYSAGFPSIQEIAIWARRPEQAEALIEAIDNCALPLSVVEDLETSVSNADIISCATMARTPILKGDWVSKGAHVDLIGAFTSDMREADDALMAKGSLYVDSRETTIHHIGELMIPIASGVISEGDIKGDFYDLIGTNEPARMSNEEITVFKNGGGAHLDLMIADYLVQLAAAS